MNYSNEMNETIYDAMCFMDAIWQCETFDDEFFTKCGEFCMNDAMDIFKDCYRAWKDYPMEGPIHYFSEFAKNWLMAKQEELDKEKELKELKEIQFADLPKGYTWECCSCCEAEVVIPTYKMSFCPNCGKEIAPCSTCPRTGEGCGNCYFDKIKK